MICMRSKLLGLYVKVGGDKAFKLTNTYFVSIS
jgi:hypothetical protein